MSKKKKVKKGEVIKKVKKNVAAIDARFKSAMAMNPPDENPFKMENEQKIDRFRPGYRNDRDPLKKKSRLKNRENRPKKPQGRKY